MNWWTILFHTQPSSYTVNCCHYCIHLLPRDTIAWKTRRVSTTGTDMSFYVSQGRRSIKISAGDRARDGYKVTRFLFATRVPASVSHRVIRWFDQTPLEYLSAAQTRGRGFCFTQKHTPNKPRFVFFNHINLPYRKSIDHYGRISLGPCPNSKRQVAHYIEGSTPHIHWSTPLW